VDVVGDSYDAFWSATHLWDVEICTVIRVHVAFAPKFRTAPRDDDCVVRSLDEELETLAFYWSILYVSEAV
jgi:hypothetical protein